jgi:Na+-transporting methylmalonyl-CoA/oxaloacetate decarboxylase gamma subunit
MVQWFWLQFDVDLGNGEVFSFLTLTVFSIEYISQMAFRNYDHVDNKVVIERFLMEITAHC